VVLELEKLKSTDVETQNKIVLKGNAAGTLPCAPHVRFVQSPVTASVGAVTTVHVLQLGLHF